MVIGMDMVNPSLETEVISAQTPAQFEAAVVRAVALLRAGEVVGLPTETVYGLAANALDAGAVAKVFAVKGRPARNPIIVHVAGVAMARRCVTAWPVLADKLALAFWPGPLTLVLPRSALIPEVVTAGGPTVGIRWSSHPFIQAVIRAGGFPLAAPSANPASGLSPTTAEHVRRGLNGRIRLVVDGGASPVGIESTVLDLTASPPRVLRPGMIHRASLLAVTGRLQAAAVVAAADDLDAGRLRSPGLLRKHYSPRAKLVVWTWRDAEELEARIARTPHALSATHVLAHTRIPELGGLGRVAVMAREAAAFARGLYAELHHCDATGAELIVVEGLPAAAEWQALADRLNRAAAEK